MDAASGGVAHSVYERRQQAGAALFEHLARLVDLARVHSAGLLDVQTFAEHGGEVVWLHELREARGCRGAAVHAEDRERDEWIEFAPPPPRAHPPRPPKVAVPWLATQPEDWQPDRPPELLQAIPRGSGNGSPGTGLEPWIMLADHPEVSNAWDAYVKTKWQEWSDRECGLLATRAVYNRLFSIYRQQQQVGESYELLLGAGLLCVARPRLIRRHLVVASAEISVDPDSGSLLVRAAGEGAAARVEYEFLDEADRPGDQDLADLTARLAAAGDALFMAGGLEQAIESWCRLTASHFTYLDDLQVPGAGSRPVVAWAPALIWRRRDIKAVAGGLRDIAAQYAAGVEIADGVRIVLGASPQEQLDPMGKDIRADRLYFPLVYNEDQRRVADLIATQPGVVVEGPPGTGKSHTIANLVAHLLAGGNRVLITSQSARALRVLDDMIPSPLGELVAAVLGDDQTARDRLESTVQAMSERIQAWSTAGYQERIRELEARMQVLAARENHLRDRLREVRASETVSHHPGIVDLEGTLGELAELVNQYRGKFGWVKSCFNGEPEPPVSEAEGQEVLELLRRFRGWVPASDVLPAPDPRSLVPSDEFERRVNALRDAEREVSASQVVLERPLARALIQADWEIRRQLEAQVGELIWELNRGLHSPAGWQREAASHMVGGNAGRWFELYRVTSEQLNALDAMRAHPWAPRITGAERLEPDRVLADARLALRHLQNPERQNAGAWLLRRGPGRQALEAMSRIRVDGQPATEIEPLRKLVAFYESAPILEKLRSLWAPLVGAPGPDLELWLAGIRESMDQLARLTWLSVRRDGVEAIAAAIPEFPTINWGDPKDLERVIDALGAVSAAKRLDSARDAISAAASPFAELPGDIQAVREIRQAVAGLDVDRYRAGLAAYRAVHEEQRSKQRLRQLEAALARAPELRRLIGASYGEPLWDSRMRQLREAWQWHRVELWLSEKVRLNDARPLLVEFRDVRERRRQTLEQLATEVSWYRSLSRMTEEQWKAIKAWSEISKRLGAAVGKQAGHLRRQAREQMEVCRQAIPAWIVPFHRISQIMPMERHLFDVVIVDEASQLGPEALMLMHLGRRVLVVGDDKQISPQNPGLDVDAVSRLIAELPAWIPHRERYEPDSSLFSIATIHFHSHVMLREHFRCMAEIIEFSNRLCYRGQLIPLKQHGSDRLEPVLYPVLVDFGHRRGPGTPNQREADALVDQLKACLADPRYRDRTMGVISLTDPEQARYIEHRISTEIDPQVLLRHRIICGDPYAFQGDERDVMFLSLVLSPDEARTHPVTGEQNVQRFNVAVSRAREQVWLFHSVQLQDVVGASNLARQVLGHFYSPPAWQRSRLSISIEDLRVRSARRPRVAEWVPAPFNSWFEADLFLALSEHNQLGFEMRPQHDINHHRVDLLIGGPKGRLAVECDGDHWEGPERWEAEFDRQLDLERAGVRFHRVAESAYRLNPGEILEELLEAIQRVCFGSAAQAAQAAPELSRSPGVAGDNPPRRLGVTRPVAARGVVPRSPDRSSGTGFPRR